MIVDDRGCMLSKKTQWKKVPWTNPTPSAEQIWAPRVLDPGSRTRSCVGATAGSGSVTAAAEISLHKLYVSSKLQRTRTLNWYGVSLVKPVTTQFSAVWLTRP